MYKKWYIMITLKNSLLKNNSTKYYILEKLSCLKEGFFYFRGYYFIVNLTRLLH
jgi:hypothetical protein